MNIEHELRLMLDKRRKSDEPLDMAARLVDLGIDSLDLVELIFDIEDKFDIQLTQSNDQTKTATLHELRSWIEQQVAAKGQPAADRAAPDGGPDRARRQASS